MLCYLLSQCKLEENVTHYMAASKDNAGGNPVMDLHPIQGGTLICIMLWDLPCEIEIHFSA